MIRPSVPLAPVIDEVHAQGSVAIVAHPYEDYWPAYDVAALQKLDGAEVVRPEAQHVERMASQLREFFRRAPLTVIGDTDYHGLAPLGYSRTYVFARTRTDQGVLDAVREGRTVVYDRERAYGDLGLIQLALDSGGLPSAVPVLLAPSAWRLESVQQDRYGAGPRGGSALQQLAERRAPVICSGHAR
jgi:hypothetical protein